MTQILSQSYCFRLTALVLAVAHVASLTALSQEHRARLKDGKSRFGHLERASDGEVVFQSGNERIPLADVQRIEFPNRSVALNSRRPARVFHLRGGGRVTGELVRFGQDSITIQALGQIFVVPRRSVLGIEQFAGERQVIYEDFESDMLPKDWTKRGGPRLIEVSNRNLLQLSPGDELLVPVKTAISGGRMSVAFFDPGPKSGRPLGGVEFKFQHAQNPVRLTIPFGSENEFLAISPSSGLRITVQPVRRASGWNTLTLLFDEARFQVLIGDKLLASGRPIRASLESLRFFGPPEQAAKSFPNDAPVLRLDDLQITERDVPEKDLPPVSIGRESYVVFESGDAVFGTIQDIDSANIQLEGVFGKIAIPWNRARRIVFGEMSSEKRGTRHQAEIKTGHLARVRFARFVDHPEQPGGELEAVIGSISDDRLKLYHPWLGEIDRPLDEMDWIEPTFTGGVFALAVDVRHLGNQHRADFQHKQPAGREWKGEFTLETRPERPAFLELAVSHLEPAGEDAPPGSRFLSELRNGFLGTEVFLNGRSLGRLNDQISQRETVTSPQTLRLRIPEELLRAGKNTWRIEQTPRHNREHEFDDCEIGPIRLLLEQKGVASSRGMADD